MMVGALHDAGGRGHAQRLFTCARCAAWPSAATQTGCGLLKPCPGTATHAGKAAMRRMSDGKHPKPGRMPLLLGTLAPLWSRIRHDVMAAPLEVEVAN